MAYRFQTICKNCTNNVYYSPTEIKIEGVNMTLRVVSLTCTSCNKKMKYKFPTEFTLVK